MEKPEGFFHGETAGVFILNHEEENLFFLFNVNAPG
jgi:hypothetical protein